MQTSSMQRNNILVCANWLQNIFIPWLHIFIFAIVTLWETQGGLGVFYCQRPKKIDQWVDKGTEAELY